MKKTISIIATLLIAFALNASRPDTLRLLCIGNSFSVDAVEQNLHEIATEKGNVIIIGNLYIGGCSLERHWNNAVSGAKDYSYRKIGVDGIKQTRPSSLLEGIEDEPWDIITFQQASHFSGMEETYEPYLGNLVEYVRQHVSEATEFYIHQTWAYASNSTHGGFKNYNRSQEEMYSRLCNAYSKAAEKYGMGVIPSGTAIQNSRTSFNGDNATRDGFHLSYDFGRYIAALCFYETLYGKSAEKISFKPEGLDEKRAELARACAHKACRRHFIVTEMKKYR